MQNFNGLFSIQYSNLNNLKLYPKIVFSFVLADINVFFHLANWQLLQTTKSD